MPPHQRKPSELVGKVFRARYATSKGLLTKAELRNPGWRRVFAGVYADADREITYRTRCLAATLVMPPDGVIAGRSAAWLHGATEADDPVELIVPAGVVPPRQRGLHARRPPFGPEDVMLLDGLRVTTPARTCWDVTQWHDLVDAIVIMDWLVRLDRLGRADIAAYAAARVGERGAGKLARAAALVDGRAASPAESRLRARLVLAGMPPPECQYTIRDDRGFLARVDLAWPRQRVALEYDGVWHATADQLHHDRKRLNRILTTHGWLVLHATARRLSEDFPDLVDEIKRALARR